ncbi:MAG: N-acetylmuramoyl-L-alanine amidase [Phycisphaerae bacterium]|nr:N-acetylmuramoyl-L-alanine amidase [Phycisphaerae bacterium]
MNLTKLILLVPMFALVLATIAACASTPRPGDVENRRGDEIMVCGTRIHTGAPVVLWTDPDGYDAYRVEKRFAPLDQSDWEHSKGGLDTPNRYGIRGPGLAPPLIDQVRGGGWSLDQLRDFVDQFVIHYDVCGTSRSCFRVLHDQRGLSVHFLLDLDGTIYQCLDVKERAWHATIANDRSIGIEIANIGAYPPDKAAILDRWYAADSIGTRVILPDSLGDGGIRTPNFVPRPTRSDRIRGAINGQTLVMHDLTPQQYESLAKLAAALCRTFPKLSPDAPRDPNGRVLSRTLRPDEFASFRGVLGHFHVQENKADPGPAFDWERFLSQTRREMGR